MNNILILLLPFVLCHCSGSALGRVTSFSDFPHVETESHYAPRIAGPQFDSSGRRTGLPGWPYLKTPAPRSMAISYVGPDGPMVDSSGRIMDCTIYNADGTSSSRRGDTLYHSSGESSRLIGRTWYHSDGTTTSLD